MSIASQTIRENLNRPGDALVRVVQALVFARCHPGGPEAFFARRGADEVSPALYRAMQTVGSIGQATWGSTLAQSSVADFLIGLSPLSAAARLFAEAIKLPAEFGEASIPVPTVITPANAGAFVEELDPIPVTSFSWESDTIGSKKLASMSIISRELARSSRADAEVKRLLRESCALVLDATLFGSSAATDGAPAGLFYGLTAISVGGFDRDPMIDTLTGLAAAVAPIAGDRIAYVASPGRAAQISMRAPALRYPVFASSALADTRIGAVALDGLAVRVDPLPEIDVSQESVAHMSDDPDLIVDSGTADPVRSMFQTAAISIRLGLNVNWTLRHAGAAAIADGFAW